MAYELTANGWLLESPRQRRTWPAPLALGVLIGVMLALAVTALSPLALGAPAARPALEARAWPERELPREWRWERKAMTFDHMFRAR